MSLRVHFVLSVLVGLAVAGSIAPFHGWDAAATVEIGGAALLLGVSWVGFVWVRRFL